MIKKSKIVFEQFENRVGTKAETRYRVLNLTNRTEPKIGSELSKSEVDSYCTSHPSTTVEIKGSKKK